MFKPLQLDGKKAQSLVSWAVKRPRPPRSVLLPLVWRHEPAPAICVTTGEEVRAGQKIALPVLPGALARHAPFAGTVTSLENVTHPQYGEIPVVEIRTSEADQSAPAFSVSRFEIGSSDFFQDMGLVDLNADMEPLHTKIAAAREAGVKTLIVNGCDPEPYVTCQYSLAMSHPLEILRGAEILRRAAGAEELVLAFQQNQMDVVELIRSKIYFLRWGHAWVSVQPSHYPHGLDTLVLWDVLKTNALDFSAVKNQALLLNLATAFAVQEAAEYGKPLLERVVTVGGECVREAKNIWVPLGTRLEDALRLCGGGLLREPGRVLVNGPMTGQEQSSLAVPVLAGTSAVLALAKEVFQEEETLSCDRCGLCVEACPAEISPADIAVAAEKKLWNEARAAGAGFCMECAACAAVCPSRIPLMPLLRSAKTLSVAKARPRFAAESLQGAKPLLF